MKENVMLLQEINVLRKDVHELNKKLRLIKLLGGGQGAGDNTMLEINNKTTMRMEKAR
jgi:hypothetical protein